MSTLKATNLQHPSAASPNVVMGSTGSVAVAGALTGAGMDLVNKTDFSAVSSVSINNVFNGTYDNYRIVFFATPSLNIDIRMRFRTGGVDNTAASYSTNSGSNIFSTGQTSGLILSTATNPENTYGVYDCMNPALSYVTGMFGLVQYGARDDFYGVRYMATTQFDGLTIYPNSGTITGTIRVYGYRNS